MRYSLALILLLTLTACASTHSLSDGNSKGPAEPPGKMYTQAMDYMDNGDYDRASKVLKSLLSRYPYGLYAQQAQMELAYAYYKKPDFDSALTAVDHFVKNYPTSPHLDYIYYLKGLIHFDPDTSLFKNVVRHDPADTDPKNQEESFDAFKTLVSRYPSSMYAPDARLRMQYLANTLARHELKIAHYYMRRGAYVAAANRARAVLTEYSATTQTMDALRVLVESYDHLGLTKLRDDAQRVIDLNSKQGAAVAAPAMAKLAAADPAPPQAASLQARR